jgi:putative tricarboxylic transport membrane protein
MARPVAALLPMLLPVMVLAMALILPAFIFRADQVIRANGLGPAAWPRTMLAGLGFFALLWIAREFWVLGRAGRAATLSAPVDEGGYDFRKALIGIALITLYGVTMPLIGFTLSTAIFIWVWCRLGGLRNAYVVAPVTLIGTTAMLWLFMGLALMPLPRGQGMFGEFSIWLLRATGIY